MVSESRMPSERRDAAKDALLLSFRAFDLAIAAAVQSGLPLGEWFRCALVHIAGKARGVGDEIAGAGNPLVTLRGEQAAHPNHNTVSYADPSKDQKDRAL